MSAFPFIRRLLYMKYEIEPKTQDVSGENKLEGDEISSIKLDKFHELGKFCPTLDLSFWNNEVHLWLEALFQSDSGTGESNNSGYGISSFICIEAALTDAVVVSVCKHRLFSSHLVHVNLSKCSILSDSALIALSIAGRKISELSVSYCSRITDVGVGAISTMDKLRMLDISRCIQVTDMGISHIMDKSKNLEYLNCSFCTKLRFTAAFLVETQTRQVPRNDIKNVIIILNMSLRKINISGCVLIKNESLARIFKCCPNIECINAMCIPKLLQSDSCMNRGKRKHVHQSNKTLNSVCVFKEDPFGGGVKKETRQVFRDLYLKRFHDEDHAATLIQACMRDYLKRPMSLGVLPYGRYKIPSKHAAVLIQKTFRGRRIMRSSTCIKRIRTFQKIIKLQQLSSKVNLLIFRLKKLEKVQAHVRGYLCRKEWKPKLMEALDIRRWQNIFSPVSIECAEQASRRHVEKLYLTRIHILPRVLTRTAVQEFTRVLPRELIECKKEYLLELAEFFENKIREERRLALQAFKMKKHLRIISQIKIKKQKMRLKKIIRVQAIIRGNLIRNELLSSEQKLKIRMHEGHRLAVSRSVKLKQGLYLLIPVLRSAYASKQLYEDSNGNNITKEKAFAKFDHLKSHYDAIHYRLESLRHYREWYTNRFTYNDQVEKEEEKHMLEAKKESTRWSSLFKYFKNRRAELEKGNDGYEKTEHALLLRLCKDHKEELQQTELAWLKFQFDSIVNPQAQLWNEWNDRVTKTVSTRKRNEIEAEAKIRWLQAEVCRIWKNERAYIDEMLSCQLEILRKDEDYEIGMGIRVLEYHAATLRPKIEELRKEREKIENEIANELIKQKAALLKLVRIYDDHKQKLQNVKAIDTENKKPLSEKRIKSAKLRKDVSSQAWTAEINSNILIPDEFKEYQSALQEKRLRAKYMLQAEKARAQALEEEEEEEKVQLIKEEENRKKLEKNREKAKDIVSQMIMDEGEKVFNSKSKTKKKSSAAAKQKHPEEKLAKKLRRSILENQKRALGFATGIDTICIANEQPSEDHSSIPNDITSLLEVNELPLFIWFTKSMDAKKFIYDLNVRPAKELKKESLKSKYIEVVELPKKSGLVLVLDRKKKTGKSPIIDLRISTKDFEEETLSRRNYDCILSHELINYNKHHPAVRDKIYLWVLRADNFKVDNVGDRRTLEKRKKGFEEILRNSPNNVRAKEALAQIESDLRILDQRDKEKGEKGKTMEIVDFLGLTKKELQTFLTLFKDIDADKSGSIEANEFLSYMGIERTIFVEKILNFLDTNADGSLDFGEFLKAVSTYCMFGPKQVLQMIFNLYDNVGKGELPSARFETMLKEAHDVEPRDVRDLKFILNEVVSKGKLSFKDLHIINGKYPVVLQPAFDLQSEMIKTFMGSRWWENKKASFAQARKQLQKQNKKALKQKGPFRQNVERIGNKIKESVKEKTAKYTKQAALKLPPIDPIKDTIYDIQVAAGLAKPKKKPIIKHKIPKLDSDSDSDEDEDYELSTSDSSDSEA